MFGFGARRRQLRAWVDILSDGSLLSGLDRSVILDLLKRAEPTTLPPGETLMRQGETGDSAYLVLEGKLGVYVETPLGEVAMAEIGAQQIVGEIAIFSRLPRTATVRSLEKTDLLRLKDQDISRLITRHPKAALSLLAALGRRVASLNQPLAMLTMAAQALEREDFDLAAMNSLFGELDQSGPFAQSFRKLVLEIENKQSRRQEMLVAARLQQSILPHQMDFSSRKAPYAVEALMRPSRDIGGDFYDFFFTDDGERAIFVVGDVSGKGIPAALFMAVSRTLLRAAVMTTPSIETALNRVNAQLEAENPECLFVTIFLTELNLKTGELRYVNAGHCDGYIVRDSGEVTELTPTAPAVAMMAGTAFACRSATLRSGDKLMLISDGITEAFSPGGGVFGEDRLLRLMQGYGQYTARQAVSAIDEEVTRFAKGCEQSDDITCLSLAFLK